MDQEEFRRFLKRGGRSPSAIKRGVKSIRARLYYDAGVDTLEEMARWDPGDLRSMLTEFVERMGCDGIAPLPKEAQNAVASAKALPKVVEY